MLLFVLRHGDPIYNPDSLTEKGHLQAEALAKRLALYGIDKIYSSPMIRAQQTARPTEILLNKKAEIEDWASEATLYKEWSVKVGDGTRWIFHSPEKSLLRDPEIYKLGLKWYEHPLFSEINGKSEYERILNASDDFLLRQGYRHDRENCRYIAENHTDERVAMFCHQGFGLSWIGTMLDIPLPIMWTNFDISHSGMTVIEFKPDKDGIVLPMVLTLSNDSHLYKEGLPTKYNNIIYF